jgi:signal transduction histidine kinase
LVVCTFFFGALTLSLFVQLRKIKKKNTEFNEAQRQQFFEIVHELRAPLTAIKDAAVLLHDMPGNLPPDKREQMLSLIKNQCIQLLEKVSGVLDASKAMSNKLVLDKRPNDLKKLVDEKLLMFTPQGRGLGIELVSDFDPAVGQVVFDEKLMNEVMNNLISNSLKYTPTGGKITISAQLKEKQVEVSVFDNGNGIPTEMQKTLFNKYASIVAHPDVPSTGLGLFVVKGIIEAHGGKIAVDTQQNRGYKVSFTLPLANLSAPTNPISQP